jgi:hypothetical protein
VANNNIFAGEGAGLMILFATLHSYCVDFGVVGD